MKKIYLYVMVLIFLSFIFYTRGNFSGEKPRYEYIGVEECASPCHNDKKLGFQYGAWKGSAHSKAFKSLSSEKAELYAKNVNLKESSLESIECLKCHITGAELDASYFTATYKKEDGVTCEACHKRKTSKETVLPEEKDCLKCHNDSGHPVSEFNFKEWCAKIAHPRPKEKE